MTAMPERVRKMAKRSPRRSRSREIGRCIACGRPVSSEEERVTLRGDVFHAACALYRRRRSAA